MARPDQPQDQQEHQYDQQGIEAPPYEADVDNNQSAEIVINYNIDEQVNYNVPDMTESQTYSVQDQYARQDQVDLDQCPPPQQNPQANPVQYLSSQQKQQQNPVQYPSEQNQQQNPVQYPSHQNQQQNPVQYPPYQNQQQNPVQYPPQENQQQNPVQYPPQQNQQQNPVLQNQQQNPIQYPPHQNQQQNPIPYPPQQNQQQNTIQQNQQQNPIQYPPHQNQQQNPIQYPSQQNQQQNPVKYPHQHNHQQNSVQYPPYQNQQQNLVQYPSYQNQQQNPVQFPPKTPPPSYPHPGLQMARPTQKFPPQPTAPSGPPVQLSETYCPVTHQLPTQPPPYPRPHITPNSPVPYKEQVGTEPWRTGLFDCMDDPENAIRTACFPCITFGQIAEIIDSGQKTCATSGLMYGCIAFLIGCPCIFSCTYRSKLRSKFGLPESPTQDWVVHCLCEWCALCQEYRELNKRGLDPSIGWQGNLAKSNMPRPVAMKPPTCQTMNY